MGKGRTSATSAQLSHIDLLRIVLALLVVTLALPLAGFSGAGGHSQRRKHGEVVTLTEFDLLSRAQTVEPTAYWVGKRAGAGRFLLEKNAAGNLYVRYLTDSSDIRKVASMLTVATYPVEGGTERLEDAARAEGEKVVRRDGFVVLASSDSRSAFVAFDERPDIQIEVYSPRPREAARLAISGAVTPVHWTPLS
jgi:hypothetical protein